MKHIKRHAVFLLFILTVIAGGLIPQAALAQEIVDSGIGNINSFAQGGFNRHCFYDPTTDRYWLFYLDGTSFYYRSSSDSGATWTASTLIAVTGFYQGQEASAFFDGVYVHVAYRISGVGLKYRMGTLGSNGVITWLAAEQSAYSGGTPTITVDSNGYPVICAEGDAIRSSTKNGIWTTDATFTNTTPMGKGLIVPLTSGKDAQIWVQTGGDLEAMRWTGTAWGSAVDSGYNVYSAGNWISAVGQDDDVHIVFLQDITYNIMYIKYSYSTNSFSGATILYEGAPTKPAPTISRATDTNDLSVWWTEYPTVDHVYYSIYDSSESTWTVGYDWINDEDGLPSGGNNFYISSPYAQDSGHLFACYVAEPQILKFKLLEEVFHVDTLVPDPIGNDTATLRGEIISLGFGSATERGFYLDITPSIGNTTGTLQLWNESGTFNVGVFTHAFEDLTEGQKYYCMAYASNDYGEGWGEWVEFTSGATDGWCVVTLEPDPIGDFEATFNGNITELAGTYASVRGFEYGYTATATWAWSETGSFTVGAYTHEIELEADTIYYVRSYASNSTTVDYGQWIGFITDQPDYSDNDDTGESTIVAPPPKKPSGWIRPIESRDWGMFQGSIPWSFICGLLLMALIVVIGLFLAYLSHSVIIVFAVIGFILGIFCFIPHGGYLDWWVMLPYLFVGWALIKRDKEAPFG